MKKERLKEETFNLKVKFQEMEPENEKLKNNNFWGYLLPSDKIRNHYAGFPSVKKSEDILKVLYPGENDKSVLFYKRPLSPMICFILTFVWLTRNFDVEHVMYLLKTSEETDKYHFNLDQLHVYKAWIIMDLAYCSPNVKCIIDCVEFKIAVPSSLVLHKLIYSDYKRHTKAKARVRIAPGVGFIFISSVFWGSISDKNITIKSRLLNHQLWKSGVELMADPESGSSSERAVAVYWGKG